MLATILMLASAARAEFPYPTPPPGTAPQDYADYMFLSPTSPLPNEFQNPGIFWKLTSQSTGDPTIDDNPDELGGVEGMSVDLAWQVTTGRPDVLIAVLDSGIEWNNLVAMNDLVRKVHLNRGELPLPENASGQTKPEICNNTYGTTPGCLNPDPYDLNDDGVFNIEDYANDPRVSDRNHNGILDPEDLIRTFSDGVDNDNNGYIDDIAGWNFLDDDNDPFDEVQFGHGTGEAEDSTAEADNGGDIGTCPNCMVMPVRVGDSFIADSHKFAAGVVFAVDSGAQVIQEALGTVNNTSFARAAIDYAYSSDVPIIASAADEESFHHNVPSGNRHTITVNSVTKFASDMTPKSYLYLNGCTNYGGNIAVAISSSSCSSEATGKGAGIAGLIISAALNEGARGRLKPRLVDHTGAVHPLSANEVAQLMTMNADDVNFSDDRAVVFPVPTVRFASIAGWDQYFGYGRENANRAVRAVQALAIPPEADLLAPDWWETLDPVQSPTVAVTGSTSAVRASSYSYQLAFGCGVQPSSFTPISQQQNLSAPLNDAALGQWSIAGAATTCGINPAATPSTATTGTPSPNDTPDQFTVTLRLRVTDNNGNVGEARRTVFLHHDPSLLAGFPRSIGGSGEASPVFATFPNPSQGKGVSADSGSVLLVPTADGTVLALGANGELAGWPVHTDPIPVHSGSHAFQSGALGTTWYEPIELGLAVGDLTGNGHVEVVADTLDGRVYAWQQDGTLTPGFPVSSNALYSERSIRDQHNRLQPGFVAPPVLADLNGDGKLEIIAAGMDRHVYAWNSDGTPVPGWPVLVVDRTQMASVDPTTGHVVPKTVGGVSVALQGTKIVSTPAVGDLDGDGKQVAVVGTNEEYREIPNFSPVGNLEATALVQSGLLSPGNGRIYAIPADGNLDPAASSNPAGPFLRGWPVHIAILETELLPWIEGVTGSPAFADVDGDGKLEAGISSVVGPAYILRADGSSLYGNDPNGLPVALPSDKTAFGAASNSSDGPSLAALGSGIFARLDSTQSYSFITPAAGLGKALDVALPAEQLPHDNQLAAWNVASGTFATAFPRVTDDLEFFARPTSASIAGDGLAEVFAGSGGYLLHATNELGIEPSGWPKFTGGWITAAAAIGNLGGAQLVAITTREGKLFVWSAPGPTTSVP